jgi:hypothetical protein
MIIMIFFSGSTGYGISGTPCLCGTNSLVVQLMENGVANEENEIALFQLVPSTPLDQDGIIFHENISLMILDLDSNDLLYRLSIGACTFLGKWPALQDWLFIVNIIMNLPPTPPVWPKILSCESNLIPC